MKIVILILMAASGISLVLAALMGVNLMTNSIWGVSGTSMCAFSAACSLYAGALRLVKPFEK